MELSRPFVRLRRAFALLVAIFLSVLFVVWIPAHAKEQQILSINSVSVPLTVKAGNSIRSVDVGLQVKNIYDLDLSSQSFQADGWYWISWGKAVQDALDRHGLKPMDILEFSNEIEPGQYQFSEVISSGVPSDPGERFSVEVKFSGKFYIDDVRQRLAPFDRQYVEIGLEVKPPMLAKGDDQITLIPADLDQFPIAGEFSSVSGYILSSTGWSRENVRYVEPVFASNGIHSSHSDYSRVTAVFTYDPDPLTIFMKWLLPLIAVMAIVILSPSIDGSLGDVRLAIPSAALLTLVVLHDGYKASFPPTPFLTYLDEIYTFSYLCCFVIFFLFLVGTNAHSRAREEDRERVTRRVDRMDLFVQLSCASGLLLVAILGWYS